MMLFSLNSTVWFKTGRDNTSTANPALLLTTCSDWISDLSHVDLTEEDKSTGNADWLRLRYFLVTCKARLSKMSTTIGT